MIPLNKPYLPSLTKYQKYLTSIYENVWLTNNGPLAQELKIRLEEYLEVKNLLLTCNGTMALQIAFKAFNLSGNIITTPYSFIATSSSIQWLGIETKFTDIETSTFNLDPFKIEKAIDELTSAIVPVHVYGNPCNTLELDQVANKNNLKLIYDAAHAFNVKLEQESILKQGDASILSFHATKLFHTTEGGAVIFNNDDDYQRAASMINFGISSNGINQPGINGKMSEMHAAMGLAMLDDIDYVLSKRLEHFDLYKTLLNNLVTYPLWHKNANQNANQNASYFPITFESSAQCTRVLNALISHNIEARRYFSPSLNTLTHLNNGNSYECPISESLALRTLCLPLYVKLKREDIHSVCAVVKETL